MRIARVALLVALVISPSALHAQSNRFASS
jgi:hypothetical protein